MRSQATTKHRKQNPDRVRLMVIVVPPEFRQFIAYSKCNSKTEVVAKHRKPSLVLPCSVTTLSSFCVPRLQLVRNCWDDYVMDINRAWAGNGARTSMDQPALILCNEVVHQEEPQLLLVKPLWYPMLGRKQRWHLPTNVYVFFFMFFLANAEQHTLHCAKRHRIGMWFCKNAQNKMEAGGKKQKSTMVFDFVAEEQTILSNTGMSFSYPSASQ